MKEDFTDFIEVSGLLDYDPDTISKTGKLVSGIITIYWILSFT